MFTIISLVLILLAESRKIKKKIGIEEAGANEDILSATVSCAHNFVSKYN